jgi:hypothetical protein
MLLTTLQFFLAIIPSDWPASKDDAKRVRKTRETDRRVYYLECSDIYEEWKTQANGGKTLWERAIEFTKSISGE